MGTTPQPNPAPPASPPEQQQPTSGAQLLELMMTEPSLRTRYAERIVESEIDRDLFAQDGKLARIFAKSGEFAELKGKTEDQAINLAMAKIQLGRSWGLGPADSMRFVFFTNGKPSLETDVIASRLQDAGWDWDIQWHEEGPEKVCVGCTLWVKKWDEKQQKYVPFLDRDGKPVSVSFTKKDADKAIIHENGKQIPLSEKWNYKSWPRDMYFSRSISRLRRYHAPKVLRGAVTRQEAEEIPAELPPDNDPQWFKTGTGAAADRVAEEKIAKLNGEESSAPIAKTAPAQTTSAPESQRESSQDCDPNTPPPIAEIPDFGPDELPDTFEGDWYRRENDIFHFDEAQQKYVKWVNPAPQAAPKKFAFGQKPGSAK